MAQIGSYVPAASAKIGLHDGRSFLCRSPSRSSIKAEPSRFLAIFTRMGATDELTQGKSTFMVRGAELATSERTLLIFYLLPSVKVEISETADILCALSSSKITWRELRELTSFIFV